VACRRRSPSVWPWALRAAAAIVVALLLAGCGGGKGAATTTAQQPRIPAAVASDLRRRADAVAAALDSGDGCAARTQARGLVQAVTQAVNRRQIPGPLLEPLTSSANGLAARITCTPPAPAAKPKEHGKGHDHGKHERKHPKHGDGGNEG
jgi:hypothetical protein